MISRISKIFNKTNLTTNTKCFNLLSQPPYAQNQQIGTIQSFRLFSTLADLRHDEVRRKIYLEIDQRTAYLRYNLNNGVLKIVTVYVPKELEGKGLGGGYKAVLQTSFRLFASIADLKHDLYGHEFYLIVNGKKASLKYALNPNKDVMKILSVYVPQELQGHGLGKILTEGAFKYVADNNLKMEILCVYAAHYLEKYAPQYKKYLI